VLECSSPGLGEAANLGEGGGDNKLLRFGQSSPSVWVEQLKGIYES